MIVNPRIALSMALLVCCTTALSGCGGKEEELEFQDRLGECLLIRDPSTQATSLLQLINEELDTALISEIDSALSFVEIACDKVNVTSERAEIQAELAAIMHTRGDTRDASKKFREATKILDEVVDPIEFVETSTRLATIQSQTFGEPERASTILQTAEQRLLEYPEISSSSFYLTAIAKVARSYYQLEDHENSLRTSTSGLETSQLIQNSREAADGLVELLIAAAELNAKADAFVAYDVVLSEFQRRVDEVDDPSSRAFAWLGLARAIDGGDSPLRSDALQGARDATELVDNVSTRDQLFQEIERLE